MVLPATSWTPEHHVSAAVEKTVGRRQEDLSDVRWKPPPGHPRKSPREGELAAVFRNKGISVTEVNTAEFRDTVLKNVPFEQYGYQKADWDRIQAIK